MRIKPYGIETGRTIQRLEVSHSREGGFIAECDGFEGVEIEQIGHGSIIRSIDVAVRSRGGLSLDLVTSKGRMSIREDIVDGRSALVVTDDDLGHEYPTIFLDAE